MPKRLLDCRDFETLDEYLRLALEEDGAWNDVTTLAIASESALARATMIVKQRGVFCGALAAERVFRLMDSRMNIEPLLADGAWAEAGTPAMRVRGPLRGLLSAERLALNLVQRLSGIATLTRRFVEAAGGRAMILDTRKTTPLWRALERYAVRAGGAANHRFALDDMFMIKDNHADAAGGVGAAVRRAAEYRQALAARGKPLLRIAAEARTADEALEAAEAGADIVMLDNMTPEQARQAIEALPAGAEAEITGGVTLANIARYAEAGAARISIGAVTHSAPALDVSLDLEME